MDKVKKITNPFVVQSEGFVKKVARGEIIE